MTLALLGASCGRYGFDALGDDDAPPGDDASPAEDADPRAADGATATATDAGPPPGCLVVTTDTDENDAGESPTPPHLGAGLSLREAIVLTNANAATECIGFARSFTIRPASNLPAVTDDTVIDGAGATVVIDGALVTSGTAVGLDLASPGATATRVLIQIWGPGSGGMGVRAFGGTTIGPDVTSRLNGVGVLVQGSGVTVQGNRINQNSDRGVYATSGIGGLLVAQNVLHANTNAAIAVDPGSLSIIRHNTMLQNGAGIGVANGADVDAIENNCFSQNAGFAIDASGTSIGILDFNAYFANAGECRGCVTGANAVTGAPNFANPPDDVTPLPGSPLINAGRDSGLDVNGTSAGLFNGSAPDIGAVESD